MIASKMLGVRPFKKKLMVSLLPMVYPARRTSSSKSAMYWSISGKCILHLSRSSRARCCSCESVKCSVNSWTNVSQVSCMSSAAGSRESSQAPMSLVHVATLGPWMSVSVIAIFQIGELRPGTRELARKYPSIASRKFLEFVRSPSNIWGRFPITRSSAFPTGAAAGIAAGGP
jgi:hypothetical protein